MTTSSGDMDGMTPREWHMVMRRVSWVRFALTILASAISFAAIGGIYVTTVDARIEQNKAHLGRIDATVSLQREQIASIRASLSASETAAARLEERFTAQGRTLNRIEGLLERLISENYTPSSKPQR